MVKLSQQKIIRRRNKGSLLFLFLLFLLSPTQRGNAFTFDSLFAYIYNTFEFLPEYHIDADIFTFMLHKNDFFEERYFLESNSNLEFSFISFKKFVYSVWRFEFQTGMGRTPGDVVFDPVDINYGLVPIFEFRFPSLIFQCGLNHHCFHEIDRHEFETIYWNKPFIVFGSKNMRLIDHRTQLLQEGSWTLENKISWSFTWGYYLRKFFGIVGEHTVNGVNKYVHDAVIDVRYAFYQRRSWIVNAHGKTTIGYYKNLKGRPPENGAYWRHDVSLESNFRQGKRGGMLFITYTLDDLPKYQGYPRFSKDKLLQLGVRFFI